MTSYDNGRNDGSRWALSEYRGTGPDSHGPAVTFMLRCAGDDGYRRGFRDAMISRFGARRGASLTNEFANWCGRAVRDSNVVKVESDGVLTDVTAARRARAAVKRRAREAARAGRDAEFTARVLTACGYVSNGAGGWYRPASAA